MTIKSSQNLLKKLKSIQTYVSAEEVKLKNLDKNEISLN